MGYGQGGISVAAYSGLNAAKIILRDTKKKRIVEEIK